MSDDPARPVPGVLEETGGAAAAQSGMFGLWMRVGAELTEVLERLVRRNAAMLQHMRASAPVPIAPICVTVYN